MSPSTSAKAAVLAALLFVPAVAAAEGAVGKISVLEGKAARVPGEGQKADLAVGSEIFLKDTIEVSDPGNIKITLNDKSVIMLGKGSKLQITEARFKDQIREGFSATLLIGSIWSKVEKAVTGGDAKFEVSTTRAVAGVRGTVFRVDAAKLVRGTTVVKNKGQDAQRVRVKITEGRVAVESRPEGELFAQAAIKATPPSKKVEPAGKRTVVGKPGEITKEAWEKKFVELQANSEVVLGDVNELFQKAEWKPSDDKDDLAEFIAKNGGAQ